MSCLFGTNWQWLLKTLLNFLYKPFAVKQLTGDQISEWSLLWQKTKVSYMEVLCEWHDMALRGLKWEDEVDLE